ncbi:TPA: toxin-coregulated pilus secretin TcpC, partial [Vibrio cholerae]|nr:toxin-coregulated pilus secretin TcpC [Vibrio cholerae]
MKKTIISTLVIGLVSGCSNTNLLKDNLASEQSVINLSKSSNEAKSRNIEFLSGAYLSERKVPKHDIKFSGKYVEFESKSPIELIDVLDGLSKQYNIQYVFSDELEDENSEENKKSSGSSSAKKIKYSGPLAGFFDYLSSAYNMHFEFGHNNLVKAYHYKNQVFNLQQYFDDNKFSSSMQIGGTSGTSSGLKGTADTAIESNSWEKIDEFLSASLGETGKFTIFEDYSLVTVKARPDKFLLLHTFFDKLINESKMQIAVDYRVVSLSEERLNQLAAKFGIENAGKYSITSDMVDAISLSQVGGGLGASYRSASARLDAVVNELSQEVMHEGHFIGIPNRVMPLNVTTNSKYISSIETTKDTNTDEETRTVKVSDLVTGFSMMVMPKILDDGRIQISSGFSRKQLVSIGTAQGITLPTVDENESMNTVTMNPGEVRLAMLFKDNYIQNSNGVQLLGGGTENKKSARYIA